MMDNKLERLRLLITGMANQAQLETNPKRKAKLQANIDTLTQRYLEEQGKVTQAQTQKN